MGGPGSGRWSRPDAAPVTEQFFKIDLKMFRQEGFLKPGMHVGNWSVSHAETGASILSVDFTAWMAERIGAIELRYRRGSDENAEPFRQRIDLDPMFPHLGGVRWFFQCPRTGKRCRILYFDFGTNSFASQEGFGLSWQSRNENLGDRARRGKTKILRRLESDYTRKPDWIIKPKGQHQKTFDREFEKMQRYESVEFAAMWLFVLEARGFDPPHLEEVPQRLENF